MFWVGGNDNGFEELEHGLLRGIFFNGGQRMEKYRRTTTTTGNFLPRAGNFFKDTFHRWWHGAVMVVYNMWYKYLSFSTNKRFI